MVEKLKTGTTTVGVVCKDGIVIAADKRATVGHTIYNRNEKKVYSIRDRYVMTLAGYAEIAKRSIQLLTAETQLNELRLGRPNTVKEAASLASNIVFGNLQSGGVAHFLLAGVNTDSSIELYDVFPDGSVALVDDFWTTGSGGVYVQGVLEGGYTKEMTMQDAIALVKKGFNASFKHDSASGNGVDIYTVTGEGVKHNQTIVLDTNVVQ